MVKCPHIVQPVRKLYQNHADIFSHGHNHFTDVFGLFCVSIFKTHLRNFCYPINENGDVFSKVGFNIFQGERGVFVGGARAVRIEQLRLLVDFAVQQDAVRGVALCVIGPQQVAGGVANACCGTLWVVWVEQQPIIDGNIKNIAV